MLIRVRALGLEIKISNEHTLRKVNLICIQFLVFSRSQRLLNEIMLSKIKKIISIVNLVYFVVC